MQKKTPALYSHKLFSFLLYIGLIVSLFALGGKSSVNAQVMKKNEQKADIGYEFGALPPDARSAMIEAIQSRPAGILDGGTYFIIGHYETDDIWGIGHLAAAIGSEPPVWDTSVWFIVQNKDTWKVAVQGTQLFDSFMNDSSNPYQHLISSRGIQRLSASANDFLFPWDKSQQWRYSFGWHGGTNLTLDFAPVNVIPSNKWILASASGTVTLVCGDSYQAAVDLSAPGGVMTYRHIDYNSLITQNVNGKAVAQGQKLAVLYNGTVGEGYYDTSSNYPWQSCVQGSSPTCVYIQFMTYCGSGSGPHVHWTLPAKPFTVDGWQVDVNGLWTKSGQVSKNIGSSFNSTNSALITITGNVGMAGATLNYTDGVPKTAIANGTGLYTFTVPSGWSGTVTPTIDGYSFTPINKAYANVLINLANQNYTATILPNVPDLVITNVTVNPPLPAANETFEVIITIKNQGGASGASEVYRDVYIDRDPSTLRDPLTGCPSPGDFFRSDSYLSLAPGMTDTKAITITDGLPLGNHQFWFYVDSRCLVDEIGEANNAP